MNDNQNYGMILNEPDNDNNLYENNNNNNDFFEYDGYPTNKMTMIIFVLSLSLIFLDFYSLYHSFRYLNFLHKLNSNSYYHQCVENQTLFEIYFVVFATFVGISGIILSIGLFINNDYYIDKLFECFLHYNYYIFGPFLLFSSIFGFINFNKIGYYCEIDPKQSGINYFILVCIIILLTIGAIITTGYSTINVFEYFNDSIKFTDDANYLLGKTFWKFAYSRKRNLSRYHYHERNE